MAAYLVATVRIHDPVRYAEYTKGIVGLSEKHGGESIVRGPVEEILEGEGLVGERVVVTRFPDADSIRRYFASPEYQAAKVHRLAASEAVMRLLHG
jgi:uncharacterized protein (DUF1330 family)